VSTWQQSWLTKITPSLTFASPEISPVDLPESGRKHGSVNANHVAGAQRCRLGTLENVEVAVEEIPAAASYPLRQRVLRPSQGLEAVVWEGDDEPSTASFGAIDRQDGAIVGVATVFPEPAPFAPEDVGLGTSVGIGEAAWRLRGMATAESVRGQGVGAMVLGAVLGHVASRGGRLIWCNARVSAVGFYERAGFATWGDEWVLASIGPHVVMWRQVEPEGTR
jgi:GNAT superfamily N-acetyltransferase